MVFNNKKWQAARMEELERGAEVVDRPAAQWSLNGKVFHRIF